MIRINEYIQAGEYAAGGVLPYIGPVWVLRRFFSTGIDFVHFCLESGTVFEGTKGVYERIYRLFIEMNRILSNVFV